jgi:hypothetical protein
MFLITWVFDKLGYMPKIDMQIGKVNIEAAWPFPDGEEKPTPRVRKTRALPSKATVAKTTARTTRAKKAK